MFTESAAVDGINVNEKQPEFSAPIKNITVPVGREAVLTCSVTELGNFKVNANSYFRIGFFYSSIDFGSL